MCVRSLINRDMRRTPRFSSIESGFCGSRSIGLEGLGGEIGRFSGIELA